MRDDSIIVDLFQGQLKSRLICPRNGRVSDQYDPFMYLEVPLPIKTDRTITVTVVPNDPTQQIIKYGLSLQKDGDVRDLRKELANVCGIPAPSLYLVETISGRIYKELNDFASLSDIQANDVIVA